MTEGLRAANDRRRSLRERVSTHGEATLRAVADACDRFERLLNGYEDSATGTGNFQTYVEFQEEVATLVEGLDEELPAREAFEAAGDALEQRTLRPKHFERARETLAPARELADLLDEWRRAQDAYAEARRAAIDRRQELVDRIAVLEDRIELGAADLDAPVDRLRDPIEAYDEAVREAVQTFRREAPAREVLAVFETAAAYPLVDVDAPPASLQAYLTETPVGERTIPELLEFAGYSRSKLDHYVADPEELKRRVATNRTYLEGVTAAPFLVGWPPPDAAELRWQCREFEAVLHRFAPERVIEALRTVRRLTHDPDYHRLQEAARARAELGPDERDRLRSGALERDLTTAREELATIEDTLDSVPAE